jgi:hypothetical protein
MREDVMDVMRSQSTIQWGGDWKGPAGIANDARRLLARCILKERYKEIGRSRGGWHENDPNMKENSM